ncbi:hypothetical protein [Nitrosococcus oceani]|uniref:Uncharacterized protein n=1 Tax=Nitrosococcus oceani C-27 TaxID=314279 RepID=A0A0E2Z5Q2_9GAMM|nr:hypothetical protein [Nitrosococcus oceani]KFI18825.1 hypothetical protein IB75_12230 [Nitrosococcus oceani C-27]
MTHFNFVPTKSYQPSKFAFQPVPRAGHDLARKAFGWVSPSTRMTSPPPEEWHYITGKKSTQQGGKF